MAGGLRRSCSNAARTASGRRTTVSWVRSRVRSTATWLSRRSRTSCRRLAWAGATTTCGLGVGARPRGVALGAALRAVGEGVVRYVGLDHEFSALLELDEAGFVTRYPGLAERVAPGSAA